MYLNGRIEESTFDKEGVVSDYDDMGNHVNCDFGISKENCRQAKILSTDTQRQERIALIAEIKQQQKAKLQTIYDTETVKYKLHDECIEQVINSYHILSKHPELIWTDDLKNKDTILIETNRRSFIELSPILDETHFGHNSNKSKPTIIQLKAFIQLREPVTDYKKNKPVYKPLQKTTKEQLIDMSWLYKDKPLQMQI